LTEIAVVVEGVEVEVAGVISFLFEWSIYFIRVLTFHILFDGSRKGLSVS
jgi:hypothetical protein